MSNEELYNELISHHYLFIENVDLRYIRNLVYLGTSPIFMFEIFGERKMYTAVKSSRLLAPPSLIYDINQSSNPCFYPCTKDEINSFIEKIKTKYTESLYYLVGQDLPYICFN